MRHRLLPRILPAALATLALFCWLISFLAGTDVWHDVGRPEIWRGAGPPYADLRVFLCAFYAQAPLLGALLVMSLFTCLRGRERTQPEV